MTSNNISDSLDDPSSRPFHPYHPERFTVHPPPFHDDPFNYDDNVDGQGRVETSVDVSRQPGAHLDGSDSSTTTSRATPQPPPYYNALPLPTDSSSSSPSGHRPPPFVAAPVPRPLPIHAQSGAHWDRGLGHSNSQRTNSSTTPGMDKTAAGGGIAGIANGIASNHERPSGMQASGAIQDHNRAITPGMAPSDRDYELDGLNPYVPSPVPPGPLPPPPPWPGSSDRRDLPPSSESDTSTISFNASTSQSARPSAAAATASVYSHHTQTRSARADASTYADDPYQRYSNTWDPRMESAGMSDFNPNDIEDDGDDGLTERVSPRRSVLSFGRHSSHGILPPAAASAAPDGTVEGARAAGVAGVVAGSGGIRGRLGRLVGRGDRNTSSGQYGPVPASTSGGGGGGGHTEKSEWLNQQTKGNKTLKWVVGVAIAVLLAGAVTGGVIGGVLGARHNNRNSGGSSRSSGGAKTDSKGDLTKDSAEITKLMGNSALHRVFPGMDYTPLNSQYPDCLHDPPSQNDITKDVAVMSQLTNRIRLYGTDCNQTEMVLHSIDVLGLQDVKVWLGVWQEKNATTNARQLEQMYSVLDKHGQDRFAGVIVGNEVLFRKDMTEPGLAKVLTEVKTNLTSKNIKLPIATSDLGDSWTAQLASDVEVVMSNVHPFFAGVSVDLAAGWTWDFWQTHDVPLTKTARHVISEVGWPSKGGNNCVPGPCLDKTSGSVAGIDQMNKFMETFVCQSLKNGTEFFWSV